ncbi:MAG: hypothetical protein Greene071421_367 [Parcubacteria group bacterium Greene0714_21]|nr:MAG: hypothetical protein Greene041639_21 [Parcubacteria group bacterium Greene0416_39]TSC98351.1 MAG: hypothetical protein Greene101447_94 [Parcubacteria group bacterium Greene1014_47]TSD04001.1 MAG: hypothetical protein Greene071421_367 [Parcubacteria group bacterium Greene0714_21]
MYANVQILFIRGIRISFVNLHYHYEDPFSKEKTSGGPGQDI